MAKHKRKRRAWTEAEIEFLRQNYGPLSAAQMAKRLDRAESSVFKKLRGLGIKKYSCLAKSNRHKKRTCFEDVLGKWAPGDKVRVTLPAIPGLKKTGESRWTKRVYTGRVLEMHERFVLVQLPAWKECINLGTIIAGEAQIELLERGKVA